MPVFLQRVRFTVHTKDQFLAGTNSNVKLYFQVEKENGYPEVESGLVGFDLDHPYHDDFQSGKADSYEIEFGSGESKKTRGGVAVPNGLRFESLDAVRKLPVHLEIEGSDRWIFDRYRVGGYFQEMRPAAGSPDKMEVVDLGWLEMARANDEVAMSTNEREGVDAYAIELNGTFQ